MKIVELDLFKSSRLKQSFLNLPFQIYRDIPQWVPPFHGDAKGCPGAVCRGF